MSVGTTARVRLSKACLVRYATYPHEPDVLEELAAWRAKAEAGGAADDGDAPPPVARIEPFNHVASLYDQANLPGERAPEEAARECRDLLDRRPLPRAGDAIVTTVVQARCRAEDGASRREVARAADDLLAVLIGGEHGVVRGGEVVPGVGLWARTDDPRWLVMLYDDADGREADADWLLVGPLWRHEVAAHKARRQFDEYRKLHRRFRARRQALLRAVDTLGAVLDRHGPDGAGMDLEAALVQGAATTRARLALVKMAGKVRRMGTSLEAQLANLQAMRRLLGSGPGLEALESRRQEADAMIAQVRAELDYAGPALEAAHDVGALHRTALMTQQNAIEKRKGARRERGNRLFALLGVWIGLLQLFCSIWLVDRDRDPRWWHVMTGWAAIGLVGVAAWLFRSFREESLARSRGPS